MKTLDETFFHIVHHPSFSEYLCLIRTQHFPFAEAATELLDELLDPETPIAFQRALYKDVYDCLREEVYGRFNKQKI